MHGRKFADQLHRIVFEHLEPRLLLSVEGSPAAAGSLGTVLSLAEMASALDVAYTSTHSFTNDSRGSHPNTVTGNNAQITVDLSSLPGGTTVYRAIFIHKRGGNAGSYPASGWSTQPLRIESADAPGQWLEPLAPRDYYIDCTAAVQRAMLTPARRLVLNMVSFPSFNLADGVRIDVTADAAPAHAVAAVTNIAVKHRNGDTMVTFRETSALLPNPNATVSDYLAAQNTFNSPNVIRYRIYRSCQPIDATTIRSAELVDEIAPLSAWNPYYYGADWSGMSAAVVPRLPTDNEVLAGVDEGIYVRRASSGAPAYYAVSYVVNGEEDLSSWTPGQNCTAAPVAEAPGPGMVLLRAKSLNTSFMYEDHVNLYYYDRWDAPPDYNLPSSAFDYLVGVPSTTVNPRPVDIALHCWGANLNGGWGWWYEADKGALLLSTNMRPYDWWTGYHENYGTIRPFTNVDGNGGGVVRNYPQDRILSFLDGFVKRNWSVDDNRILVTGNSMGGAGAIMWGARGADRFAYASGWVGVYIPRETPTFKGSFEGVYGPDAWNCQYEDTGMSAFDYWDSARFVLADPGQDVPYLCFANGKNDEGIGWPQAWRFVSALVTARQPVKFNWGQGGHLERAQLPGGNDRYIGIVIGKDQTLPAFTRCSLDGNMGDGTPANGDAAGAINAYLLWQTNDPVDLPGRWEMTVYLTPSAPQNSATVDITPRRTQQFDLLPGTWVSWTNTSVASGSRIASGRVQADQWGLVTVAQTTVAKGKDRITMQVTGDADGDGQVAFRDYQILEQHFGATGANWATGDFDGDQAVTYADYQLLESNYGKGAVHLGGSALTSASATALAGDAPADLDGIMGRALVSQADMSQLPEAGKTALADAGPVLPAEILPLAPSAATADPVRPLADALPSAGHVLLPKDAAPRRQPALDDGIDDALALTPLGVLPGR